MRISDWSSNVCSSDLRDRPDAAERVVDGAAHEDRGIAVVEAVAADKGVEAVEPAAEPVAAVEQQTEVAAADLRRRGERLFDAPEATRRKAGIGMQEQQDGRSAGRRVGNECGSTCRSRWSP